MTRSLHECEAAREKLTRLIAAVCGSCEKSCCHHGTMMGSQDLRRLRKGLLATPDFARRFFAGLQRRLDEVQADIQQLWELCEVIDATRQVSTTQLRLLLTEWESFVGEARAVETADMDGLRRLLLFSAKRSGALRAVRAIPGAADVLQVMGPRPALRFQRRRLPADRCLFHYDGCLAEDWKPAKCASFFCPAEPGLMGEVFAAMRFDDFVKANVRTLPAEELIRLVELEAQLGDEYLSSKVILGRLTLVEGLTEVLHANGIACEVRRYAGGLMLSRQELLALSPGRRSTLGVLACDGVSGAALYEIGMAAADAAREQPGRAWYVVARSLVPSSPMPHPLWQDRAMSQPIGALEMYMVAEE